MRESANVWLKSRAPKVATRLRAHDVTRTESGYADIVHQGRRFRYSHSQYLRSQATESHELWLVFEDRGAA